MGFSAVGTNTHPLPSNTREFRWSTLHASPPTGETSRHPSNHRTRTIRWSETTGVASIRSSHVRPTDEPTAVPHPTPVPTRSSRNFLKRRWAIFVLKFRSSFANTFSSFLPPFLHIRRRYGYIGNSDDIGSYFGLWDHRTSHCNACHVLLCCDHDLHPSFPSGPRRLKLDMQLMSCSLYLREPEHEG